MGDQKRSENIIKRILSLNKIKYLFWMDKEIPNHIDHLFNAQTKSELSETLISIDKQNRKIFRFQINGNLFCRLTSEL